MPYLLGIDVGTSGTKTELFDVAGNSICADVKEYALSQPENGWAEQNPVDWWQAVCHTCKTIMEQTGISPAEIAGIGLTGQMHGLVMLDENGDVLMNSIIWCDQRTAKECEEITETVGYDKLISITANPALTGFTASKIQWVKRHKPEIYAKCRHILLPKDYIRYMLTGEFATDVSDASGMQLLDVPNRKWSKEILDLLEIDPSLLGKVYESLEITGQVTAKAAEKTGLYAGIPVVAGAGDNAAAAVGTGVVEEGKAFTTIGTSGVVFAHTQTPVIDEKGRVHTFCCAVPGQWHVMGVTQAAGLSLQWFHQHFCTETYKEMDEMAADIPIGADKLLYLPYLMGERTPHLDADCRGVFFGLSARHTKAHFVRAVLEGVIYSLNDCGEVLKEMGVFPDTMAICGGGGKSPLWSQMLADMMQCEVYTIAQKQGTTLGAAILAGVGVGIYQDVPSACKQLICKDKNYLPISGNFLAYEKYYKVYCDVYQSLKQCYKALAKL